MLYKLNKSQVLCAETLFTILIVESSVNSSLNTQSLQKVTTKYTVTQLIFYFAVTHATNSYEKTLCVSDTTDELAML